MIRNYLYAFRTYIEHVREVLAGTPYLSNFDAEVYDARDHHNEFGFIWELRNFAVHQSGMINVFIPVSGSAVHFGIEKVKLNGYNGDPGLGGWRWGSVSFLSAAPAQIDINDAIRASHQKLQNIQDHLSASMMAGADEKDRVKSLYKILEDTKKEITCHIGYVYLGHSVFSDDKTDVPETSFMSPPPPHDKRPREMELKLTNWDTINYLYSFV